MNGIFDTLVLRERGQAGALAPRLPAMFESAPVIDDAPAPVERAAVPIQAAPAPAPLQPQRAVVPPAPAEVARPVTVFVPEAPGPQPRQMKSAMPEPPTVPAPQLVTVHTIETRAVPAVRVERETVTVPAPQRREPPQPRPRVDRPGAPLAAAVEAAKPVRPLAPPPPAAPPRLPLEVRVVPAPGPQALRVQPMQARQRAMPQTAAAPLPAAPVKAPDVHITIGRVEVRATSAPARPARGASGPAPVSLDQYLSQRNKQGTP